MYPIILINLNKNDNNKFLTVGGEAACTSVLGTMAEGTLLGGTGVGAVVGFGGFDGTGSSFCIRISRSERSSLQDVAGSARLAAL